MLTLGEAAGRLSVSARTVPVFTQMRFADLPASIQEWLSREHGLPLFAAVARAYFPRMPRQFKRQKCD